nr:hypothetical protein [Cytophagales bacterium]
MRTIFILCMTCLPFLTKAQEITGKIQNHGKTEMDMVLMLFGMDNPISIGKVDKKGVFTANLENLSIATIPEDSRSMSMGPLYFSFYFSCNGSDAFGEHAEKPAARQDFVRLTNKGEWAGTAFLVSDESLIPWIEDSGYNNAVEGSFYEIIYVEEDVTLSMTCSSSVYASDNEEVPTEYIFDIELKKGFNWIEYIIEQVYETNPDIRASFPSKVKITNLKDPSKMKWVGTYY